jgi:hypothetical protein
MRNEPRRSEGGTGFTSVSSGKGTPRTEPGGCASSDEDGEILTELGGPTKAQDASGSFAVHGPGVQGVPWKQSPTRMHAIHCRRPDKGEQRGVSHKGRWIPRHLLVPADGKKVLLRFLTPARVMGQ